MHDDQSANLARMGWDMVAPADPTAPVRQDGWQDGWQPTAATATPQNQPADDLVIITPDDADGQGTPVDPNMVQAAIRPAGRSRKPVVVAVVTGAVLLGAGGGAWALTGAPDDRPTGTRPLSSVSADNGTATSQPAGQTSGTGKAIAASQQSTAADNGTANVLGAAAHAGLTGPTASVGAGRIAPASPPPPPPTPPKAATPPPAVTTPPPPQAVTTPPPPPPPAPADIPPPPPSAPEQEPEQQQPETTQPDPTTGDQ